MFGAGPLWQRRRRQQGERARHLAQGLECDTGVDGGGVELSVAEQDPRLRGDRLWITRMSVFRSSRCVAKLCRSVCIDPRLSSLAATAAAWQARLSWRVVPFN